MPTSLLMVVLLAAAAKAPTPSPSPAPAAFPAPIHVDGKALEDGIVDATRAFLQNDLPAARAALDRADAGCRRAEYDEKPAWPRAVVNDDMALHNALDKARELTSAGQTEKAVETLVWVGRTCRECHARATDGALPGQKLPPFRGKAVDVR
jgi:predicted phage gp36 major capsid-like protein